MQKKVLTFMLAFVLSLSFVTTASAMGYHERDIEKYIIWLIREFFLTTYFGGSQAGMKDVSIDYYVFKN